VVCSRDYALELVGLRPDLIVAIGTPSLAALKQETRLIPIIFGIVNDPVAQGFIPSMSRPDGNITGFSFLEYSMVGKSLEMLKLVAPRITRVAVMFNPETTIHRIRHYGLLANGTGTRAEKLARTRELIAAAAQVSAPQQPPHDGTCQDTTLSEQLDHPCPHCGSRMQIIETFEPGHRPRHRPSEPVVVIGMNTS
jgi:hypothetical protein